ncbi:MAG: FAD-dependent oxidoreductase, partial [Deltaproteobacteria bacterium]|nr:FAD-dependent oxidoreductase [Deltaproteobacteria bacterium]
MRRSALFTTARIGDLVSRNRIAMPAIHLGLAKEGRPTPAAIRFYEERARGGAGVITVGVCDSYGDPSTKLAASLGLWDNDQISPMSELSSAINEHGALAGVQLVPVKGYNEPTFLPQPKELTAMIESLGQAAERARSAGFDFVELMLSGGSVLSHFLSPALSEQQVSGYAGGWDERLRAPLEAVSAMIEAVGDDMPVLVRIHGHEFLDEGYGIEGARIVVPALERAGVSAFNVTGGGHRTTLPQITHQTPPLAFAHLARLVRVITDRPVLFGGRLRTLDEAEACLAGSGADFVNLGRALIADPEWPNKALAGLEDTIVPCMACGGCFDQAMSKRSIICSLNPEVGFTGTDVSPVAAADERRKVLVAGAGPAGLQAAWTLSRLGHEVVVREREPVPGGRWRLASRLHGREDLSGALAAFVARLTRAGVPIETGVEVTPESVAEHGADVLILAVGAPARWPDIPGLSSHKNVLKAEQVIERAGDIGNEVVIIGAGGAGVELGIHLAGQGEPSLAALGFLARYGKRGWLEEALEARSGREVTVIRRRGYAGRGMGRSVRWTMMRDVERLGVRVIDRCEYEKVTPEGVHIKNGRTGEQEL